jgi:hypothetical protein
LGALASPPVDICSTVIQNAGNRSTGDAASNAAKLATAQARARSATMGKQMRTTTSKGLDAMEPDNAAFTDLAAAYENILNGISPIDDLTSEKEKTKEKKKGNAQDSETKGYHFSNYIDPEYELPTVYKTIMENCEQAIRWRLERLFVYACNTLRELRAKGLECYMLLDDWIASRFSSEMNSIREFLYVIKDAIESESRLPNVLLLDGVNKNNNGI